MSGVFPENTAHDTFASDIAGNDSLQVSINFSFDGGFHTREDSEVLDKAITMLNSLTGTENIGYSTDDGSILDGNMNQRTEGIRGGIT